MDFARRASARRLHEPRDLQEQADNHKSDIWALGCVLRDDDAQPPVRRQLAQRAAIKIVKGATRPSRRTRARSTRSSRRCSRRTRPSARPRGPAAQARPRHADLIADIVSRPQAAIGEGTMVVPRRGQRRRGARPDGRPAPLMKGNRDAEALEAARGPGAPRRDREGAAPKKAADVGAPRREGGGPAGERAQREEDRKRLVEDAPAARQEHEDLIKHLQRARERAGIAPRPGGGGGGGNAVAARARPASSAARRKAAGARARTRAARGEAIGGRGGRGSARAERKRARR